jgi:D-sedoheptulose 7-phosphate isomerase
MDTSAYIPEYLDGFAKVVTAIDPHSLNAIATRVCAAYDEGRRLFLAGNGGSAAIASHAVADFAKTMLGKQIPSGAKRFAAISLVDNAPLLTAWANDVGYDTVFAEQLRNLAQPNDVLFVISSSGNSPNVLRAIETAKEMQVKTVGLFGFDGGKAAAKVDHAVVVHSDHYGYIEDAHMVIMHLITDLLKKQV